ncbi:MAG: hypothetical protein ACREJC_08015 [Tepidisphaeraceae bacterium]
MLVVMQSDATADQIDSVCCVIGEMGYKAVPMPGGQRTAIGLVGNDGLSCARWPSAKLGSRS